ncbi:MAG: tRNA 4-thiouridine(8) synthase ThiI [Treponema sp.]|jgi:thiamine biosynthesis protein ThiI|nr:tRNA 4-thiouridine(8) synthase ThiI [Treponema sp.]
MDITWLLKPGELVLKGDNRKLFEHYLQRNIQRMLKADGKVIKFKATTGRYYITAPEEQSEFVENALSRLIGISGWARTIVCEKTPDAVFAACLEEGNKIAGGGAKTFKIEARRTDKSFPMSSYEICCKCGEIIYNKYGLAVKINNPDNTIRIEIREKALVYSGGQKGLGGLPVGTAGKGLLLLSGGIDSPVAGFLMAARGMSINAIHFHSYPFTSNEAKQKTIDLAKTISSYCMGLNLYILNFTKVQMKIKEKSPASWATVLLRMAMMEAAEKTAQKIKCKCLITGESLSQVASQTIENLGCTQNRIKLPVVRPLIGMNKENIIKEAMRIGTYDISIQPYEDCCTLFTPKHPVLYGKIEEANRLYEELELETLIDESIENLELKSMDYKTIL